jgi:hypothetical protein
MEELVTGNNFQRISASAFPVNKEGAVAKIKISNILFFEVLDISHYFNHESGLFYILQQHLKKCLPHRCSENGRAWSQDNRCI